MSSPDAAFSPSSSSPPIIPEAQNLPDPTTPTSTAATATTATTTASSSLDTPLRERGLMHSAVEDRDTDIATATASGTASAPGSGPADDKMVGWHSLPAELRSLILRYAIEAAQQKPRSYHLSALAVVCGEWQELVEAVNFASLKLISADLSDFDSLVNGRRRAWLRHIWLKVELPKYGKKKNCVPETDEEQQTNDIHFTTDVQSLFELLARWPVEDCPAGLEFELSARSPSDTQKLAGALGVTEEGDSRYFDSHLDFAFLDTQWLGSHGLPMVDVITKFAVLRRCWRNIDPNAILSIVSSLPRITELRYEPFQQFDDGAQEVLDMDRARLIPHWPKTLKRISLFEHFDQADEDMENGKGQNAPREDDTTDGGNVVFVDEAGVVLGEEFLDDNFVDVDDDDEEDDDLESDPNETEPRTCAALAMTVARRSIELEELSVAFMCDARHFFQPFFEVRTARQPDLPVWQSLRWLSLTSSALHYDTTAAQLNSLFLAAAKAARRMPALRAMEIFNTCKHCSGAFRYVVGTTSATIEWEGSWSVEIADNVERTWREVARTHAGCDLVVRECRRIPHKGMFHFVNHNLATRDLVVHNISANDMATKKYPAPAPRLRLR
ncbi:hypothetical protein F5X68DRAFT_257480 [Plectosphaerella plurivora]|uniref:DUF6546 domain-containing protein n=1 Tax=Plectosphaerella plurivora TaxID=936078 RepID=A0A9P8VLV1_9PEZI|nr:hypothetical protein F5X68DRAFT_257480 [Plectosphaerella plurivora]